jgi:hypothetical protein
MIHFCNEITFELMLFTHCGVNIAGVRVLRQGQAVNYTRTRAQDGGLSGAAEGCADRLIGQN